MNQADRLQGLVDIYSLKEIKQKMTLLTEQLINVQRKLFKEIRLLEMCEERDINN